MDELKQAVKSSIGWLEMANYTASPTDVNTARAGLCAVSDTLYFYNGSSWATVGSGTGSTTFVGLTDTPADFTSAANKFLRVNATSNAVEFDTLTGDVTIAADGATAIASGVIIDADVKSSAAIAWSKMASATDISSTGTVTDLTITSEAQGDVIYFNGTNWVRLAPGTSGMYLETQGAAADPQWASVTATISSGLSSPFSIEGGTYDPVTTVTTQTISAAALTIPDLGGTAQEWVLSKQAVTLLNKTLDDATCKFGDTADATKDLFFSLGDATTGRTMTIVSSQDNDYSLTLPNATDTLVGKATTDSLSNKTLAAVKIATTDSIFDAGGDAYLTLVETNTPKDSIQITQGATTVGAKIEAITSETNADLLLDAAGSGDVTILNGTDLTFRRATQDALIVVADQTGEDHTFNIPNIATGASDTFAFIAESQTLTNKGIDAATNTLANINAEELDPVGDAAFGVQFVISKTVASLAAAGTNILSVNPKMKVLDVWFVATSADSGTISVNKGQVGAVGNAITDTITIAAADKGISRASTIDDAEWEVAEDGGIVAVGDGGASIDGTIFVLCMRVD